MKSIQVKVVAGAKQNTVLAVEGGYIVRVTARAVDGQANAAVLRALSDHLDVPKSRLTITRGASARRKIIQID